MKKAKSARKPAKKTKASRKTNKTNKAKKRVKGALKQIKVAFLGMMGDGTEEQNLNQRGNPAARIKKKDVSAAFGKKRRK